MAENRSGTAKKKTASKTGTTAAKGRAAASVKGKTAGKGRASAPRETVQKEVERRPVRDENSFLHRILPYVFVVCAVLLTVCFVFHDSPVGGLLYQAFFGLLGIAAVTVPALLCYFALCWRGWVRDGSHLLRTLFALICEVSLAALVHLIYIAIDAVQYAKFAGLFKSGATFAGGGAAGGSLGVLFYKGFGLAAGVILICAILFVFGIFLFGMTPRTIWINLKYQMKVRRERRAARAEAAAREREFEYESDENGGDFVPPDASAPFESALSNPDFDMHFSDGEFETQETPQSESAPEESEAALEPSAGSDEDIPEPGGVPIQQGASLYKDDGRINLDAIFVSPGTQSNVSETGEETGISDDAGDPDAERGGVNIGEALGGETLGVTKESVETAAAASSDKPKPETPVYRFPPVTLLAQAEHKRGEDVGTELRANAQKLVETLRSFNVKVSISSVSRGPTITRYELIPEAGTRVRSIANLVDDISLSLATSGIRIEAPIPGKAAVGIEVPNRIVATVTLRELIEDKSFTEAKSRLTVCLGKDVGGTPIIFDIAKMPHLLIAGATGMGKSVCINSLITSILYKATPEEVKLMLIDPKKVEFNVYNGIPHLQTPVVSEPKKAAGALHWAVTEMERRYELIEDVGARKIETYNEIARTRGMEVLPYIVIIIDELADLMMTAPDAVEDSICRLAQKARAAGMHIIIGTQRPSVDVITGLIKANIPSRIAFTVASQVDSRTIIDIAGAEKLIGRGDMLYYPVGLSKPMRVQGAFVSEDEVEKITGYIKRGTGEIEYDEDVMESIEREARAIDQSGKKSSPADADDGAAGGDAKLRDALEIATDLGKISTSLLQRKLSIGYGRAAKIIDTMEARGFVSAPDGQKPREVLITKTQYREMVVNNDERLN